MIVPFDFEQDVAAKLHDLKVQREAKRLEATEFWTPPSFPTSAYDQLAEGDPEIDWVVEELISAGIALLNAQWKTGKTTLLMNLARDLLMREAFLGRFEVRMKDDERVGYLNMELPKRQFNSWLKQMELSDEALKRLSPYHAMEYGFSVLDFSNDQAVQWITQWLIDSGITVLFADPLAKLYNPARWGGIGDPNAAFTQWWKVLEDITREAKLRAVVIAHHTGFAADAADRARGASAMMDNPTVNVAFRHNGASGDLVAPDTKRYFKAMGRDVLVDEFELDYLPMTRRYYVTGGGNRIDAEMVELAKKGWHAVLLAGEKGEKPNKTDLFADLDWPNTGNGARKYNRAYKHALKQNWVEIEPGKQGAKLHKLGRCRPDDDQFGLKLQSSGEDDDT